MVQTSSARTPGVVLYRKYRPTRLEDVVGQEAITSALLSSLKRGKIAHAYLFIGPRGTGKTSVARIFAHAINGFDYQVEDHYLDIIEIDAASNTGVDNIRELREKAVIAPTQGKYKVYIIDEVHMLTKSASNALLKTLEEPPEHVIFIMATTDAHKVPITISSRTQVHTFQLADPETMFQHLRKISDLEQIPITDDALKIIVRRGGGSFRDSLSLLDQIATLSDSEITTEKLNSALGLPAEQTIQALLQAYAAHDGAKLHQLLHDLLNTGLRPEIIASECIAAILETPETALLPLLKRLPDVQAPFPEAKLLLALLETDAKTAILPVTHLAAAPSAVPAPAPSHPTPEKSPVSAAPERPKAPNSASEGAETPSEPVSQPPETSDEPATPVAPQSFSWDLFLETIQGRNLSVANQLKKCTYEFDGQTVHLYPANDFAKKILERPEHTPVIAAAIPNLKFVIHSLDDRPQPKDATLSQISAIMGNIQEVKGDLPF